MLIGIISDTHGDVYGTRLAVRVLASLEVDVVLHCGDIGSPEVVPLFFAWTAHFVFGNVDRQGPLREAIQRAGQACHERFGTVELDGRRIALLHGDDQALLKETVQSGRWDLVCHGHTHSASQSRHGETLVVNPGAVARTLQSSVAIVELPTLVVTPIPL